MQRYKIVSNNQGLLFLEKVPNGRCVLYEDASEEIEKARLEAYETAYSLGYQKGRDDAKSGGWRPASEKPERDGTYLILYRYRIPQCGDREFISPLYCGYSTTYGWAYMPDVTHWMPIPEVKSEDGKNIGIM